MATSDSIAYFGLGSMGSALAASAVRSRLNTYVWNRTKDRAEVKTLVQDGAQLVKDPGEALKAVQVLVICLLDYDSVYAVLESIEGLESLLKDKTILNLTTAHAEEGPAMNTWLRERGVNAYFEGAIMHLPQHVGTDDAMTYISGETQEAFSKIEPLLKSMGPLEYLGGDHSGAALYDAAILSGMYGMFGGCITAIALFSKVKPSDPKATRSQTLEVVNKNLIPMLKLTMEWVTKAAECFDQEDWQGYFATNDVNYHAMNNIIQSCKSRDIDERCITGIQSLFERATVKEGKGDSGLGLLATYLLEQNK